MNPFLWKDCSPSKLAVNFTYNTNAIFRILSNLADQNLIPKTKVTNLLDRACLLLCQIYKFHNNSIIKHINNNINMYIISKIIETLLGQEIYSAEYQEPVITARSLEHTLKTVDNYARLSTLQLMAISLGSGVAFIEEYIGTEEQIRADKILIEERIFAYAENPIAIDHRNKLINRVKTSDSMGVPITMCTILDDTAETVYDLLWISSVQMLVEQKQLVTMHLVGFSATMFSKCL